MSNVPTVNGRKFVPALIIGFVVFTIVGLVGTYALGSLFGPEHKLPTVPGSSYSNEEPPAPTK